MKTNFFLFPLLTLLFSCEQEGDFTQDVVPVIIDQQNSTLEGQGLFSPTSGINVNGSAKVFLENNLYKLKLVDFSISSGPDLKVYLSKSNMPTDFVNLGNLNASTVYSIPQNIDLKEYKYVLIHCQQYNHLFAIAELTIN